MLCIRRVFNGVKFPLMPVADRVAVRVADGVVDPVEDTAESSIPVVVGSCPTCRHVG